MDAFTVAAEMLGDLQLTSGQLAQLRAIDRKYFQEVYTLLHQSGEDAERADAQEASLTPQQIVDLRAMIERDVRGLLTPEQRLLLDRDESR